MATTVDRCPLEGSVPTPDPVQRRLSVSYHNAMDSIEEIKQSLAGKKMVIFLDYDGTLTPIVDNPDMARMSENTRRLLENLSKHFTVAIVTGRSIQKITQFVQLPSLYYAGSHGFDIIGPEGHKIEHKVANELLPQLDEIYESLLKKTGHIQGSLVEHGQFTVSVHYRHVDPSLVPELESIIDEVLSAYSSFKKTNGKKVFELKPRVQWNKGEAVLWLLKTLKQLDGRADDADVVPIYFGDDVTDEDAFRVLQRRGGVGVLVTEESRDTNAQYTVSDPRQVAEFLSCLCLWAEQKIVFG
eukprot:GILJ01001170.1.p1 GENE.GILJ01001170.1~~GILJ01001170.1.p1  ORF type:complete len:299 (-),score=44.72 GILJ01001170.1:510-1406(-)